MDSKLSIYGLVGYPLGHSFSRAFFSEKFAREGIMAKYRNFELPDIALLPGVIAETPGLRGFNVTIPYKQAVMPLLDRLNPDAAEIGAVNVVRCEADGTLTGYNSDVYGFVESLRPLLSGGNHTDALVLGTGGASRAVCYGLRMLSLNVTRVSRTPGKDNITYADLTPDIMARNTVIVNTTPLGMYPNVDTAPDIPYERLTRAHVCYDLVYNPEQTLFMKRAEAQGATTTNGLRMLHLQALRAWDIWTHY